MRPYTLRNKIVITIILFVIFYASFVIYSDTQKMIESYKHLRVIFLIPILGFLVFSIFIRSLLQRVLLEKINVNLSIKQNFLLFTAGLSMLITPGGSGQMIKSHYIAQKYGHPISRTLPLVFAELFYNFITVVLLVAITIILFYSSISLVIVIVCSILLAIILATVKNKKFFYMLRSLTTRIKFLNKILPQTLEFHDSLHKLLETRVMVRAWPLVICAYIIEAFVVYLGFLAFDINLGYLQTIQTYYTSVLYGTLSLIPGGAGILEGSFVKLLSQKGFDLSLITSLIIFVRLTTTWFSTSLGFVVSYFFHIRNRSNESNQMI